MLENNQLFCPRSGGWSTRLPTQLFSPVATISEQDSGTGGTESECSGTGSIENKYSGTGGTESEYSGTGSIVNKYFGAGGTAIECTSMLYKRRWNWWHDLKFSFFL